MIDPNGKYIFLDFDGVINSDRDFFEAKYYANEKHVKNGGKIINRGCLAYLERIIDDTDARIVLSTNWRRNFTVDEIYDILVKNGFSKSRNVICDEIPPYGFTPRRGYEINEFVEEYNLTNFVIIDDIDEGIELHFTRYDVDSWDDQPHSNYIRTDATIGLTGSDANAAINILGRNQVALDREEKRKKDLDLLMSCMV